MSTARAEPNVHTGLARLTAWLDGHPEIPVASVGYLSADAAVLRAPAGRDDALTAAVHAAEALTNVGILIEGMPHNCYITVTGWADSMQIEFENSVYEHTSAALKASLGTPLSADTEDTWTTTASHLRSLLPESTQAGA